MGRQIGSSLPSGPQTDRPGITVEAKHAKLAECLESGNHLRTVRTLYICLGIHEQLDIAALGIKPAAAGGGKDVAAAPAVSDASRA